MRFTNARKLMASPRFVRCTFRLLLLCIVTATTHAQDAQPPSINLGDPAPPLRVRDWLKGAPVQKFEKGRVYVLEFWATWCRPCIAAMPHLSVLARQYKDKVTILGIDVLEKKTTPLNKVRAFVDSMGPRMDYLVAVEDSNFMVAGWLEATGEQDKGIPRTIVVDAEGRLAWFGHPKDLAEVLPKIINNTWDVKEALANRNEQRRLKQLDYETTYTLMKYKVDQFKPGSVDRPDSALLAINEIVKSEPKLKYAPFIAASTFSALLKTDPHKAYEYGKEVLAAEPVYEFVPSYALIINNIKQYSDKLNLPLKIYELGAEVCQVEIDQIVYPELANIPRMYNKMADMHWRAKNKVKAIASMQKAIEALRTEKNYSKTEMAAFESRLQQYRNM